MGLFGKKKDVAADVAAADATVDAEGGSAEGCEAEGLSDKLSDEIIAVIAAAVAAYGGEQYRQALYIRKLDRSAGVRPAWGIAGTNEAIDVRRM